MSRLDAALSSVLATPRAPPYQQAATPTPPWLNPGRSVYPPGGPTGTAGTRAKPTSSVSLPAIPVAGQLPTSGSSSSVSTANSRAPSSAAAVTRASVQIRAPEQYCLVPSSSHPSAARLAVTLGPGGFAAHTPQRRPGSGRGPPSSARIATASACPSHRRASDRSSPARSASAAHRCLVAPAPGSGRSSRPASTAAANPRAVRRQSAAAPSPPCPPWSINSRWSLTSAPAGPSRAKQVDDVVGVLGDLARHLRPADAGREAACCHSRNPQV